MPPKYHPSLLFSALILLSLTLSSCGKKAQLEVEAAQLQAAANEQNVILKSLQAESAAVGNLGTYNYPQQAHMDQLRARIKTLREQTLSLTDEKAAAQKDVDALQKELDEYRARHLQ
jgi:predicted  nucleic acid-binding Zn-ribbon protein